MAIFFLSENTAVEDGQETDPCSAGLLSRALAYSTNPVSPNMVKALYRTANNTYLKTGVLIFVGIVILLFEENMKGRDGE